MEEQLIQMFTSNEIIAVLCAYICGVILGIERATHNSVVGVRTHALVSMGACVFTLMAAKVGKENTLYAAVMIGGIISGIGFFARGAVMQEEDGKNTNQPTAATVWISAAIGVTAGMMQLPLAFAITVIVVATTYMTEKVNKRVQQHRNRRQ